MKKKLNNGKSLVGRPSVLCDGPLLITRKPKLAGIIARRRIVSGDKLVLSYLKFSLRSLVKPFVPLSQIIIRSLGRGKNRKPVINFLLQ